MGSCKKDKQDTPPPTNNPVSGYPNNLISWTDDWGFIITSRQNSACLQNGTLSIHTRSGLTQDLTLTVPNFTGPGTYQLGNNSIDANNVSATYWHDASIQAPPFTAFQDSAGYLEITSYNAVLGLSGMFHFTLNQGPSNTRIFQGTFDQIRPYCPDGHIRLTYLISPFSAITVSRNDSYSTGLLITSNDVSIVLRTTDSQQVQNPSVQWNTFVLRLPHHIETGDHGDPVGMEGFGLTYDRPSLFHTATTHSTNQLMIEEHHIEARHIKGTYQIKLSNNQTASGIFDTYY
jgi:hypothetical protein